MKKWFIHCETDMSGTDMYEIIEAETEKDAEYDAHVMASENFQSYDFSHIEENCEQDGVEYIEGEYYGYNIEEYNPEKHNGFLDDSELKEATSQKSSEVKG